MSSSYVLVKDESYVRQLLLNRPQTKNSINTEMYLQLAKELNCANGDESVKVVVLSGVGGNFCSGNDLEEFDNSPDVLPGSAVWNLMHTIRSFQKPLIAAVDGYAVGIGATMLLHCDLIYSGNNAKYMFPFNNLGLTVEFGLSRLLPERVGLAKANELVLLGEAFDAETAFSLGIVNSVHEEPLQFAIDVAKKLTKKQVFSTARNKHLLKENGNKQITELIDEELIVLQDMLERKDAKEAFLAFREKRTAKFD